MSTVIFWMDHLLSLLLSLGILAVAAGIGRLLLTKAGSRFSAWGEMALFCFGVGSGCVSLSVFVLCSLGLLGHHGVLFLGGICILLGFLGWTRPVSWDGQSRFASESRTSWPLTDRCVLIGLCCVLLFGWFLVLTPAVGKDALIYHLAVPKLLIKRHGFYFVEGNIFAHYPLGQEMLYVLALALKGEVVAKSLHFSLAVALLVGMWQLGRHYIPHMAFLSVSLLVFYTIPSVFSVSHVAYNDLAVSLYTFLALYAYIRWFQVGDNVTLALCGTFTGIALGTKYTALFLPFLALLGILWNARRRQDRWQQAVRYMMLFFIPAVVVGAPFYVKNWIITTNPFYPFLYGIFGGKGLDPEQAHLYDLFVRHLGMGRRWQDFLLLPWNVSFNAQMASPRFDGILGPVFLLVLPFAFGIRRMATEVKILLSFALLVFLFWASSAQQIRYLIPLFPVLALVLSYILSHYKKRKIVFVSLCLIIASCVVFNVYHIIGEFRKVAPFAVITGQETKKDFLRRMLPVYEMYQTANAVLPEDGYLFLVYMKNYGYLCDRPYYADAMFESYTLQKILTRSESAQDVSNALKKRGFTHVMYDDIYITGEMSPLTNEEKNRFLAFREHYAETVKVGQKRYHLCRIE